MSIVVILTCLAMRDFKDAGLLEEPQHGNSDSYVLRRVDKIASGIAECKFRPCISVKVHPNTSHLPLPSKISIWWFYELPWP
jgi:hypothetical protein